MTLSKKQFCLITLLLSAVFLACLLLLCGCGEKAELVATDGNGEEVLTDEQGNWSTDGNVWYTSSGDAWSTDGNAWYFWWNSYPNTIDGVTYAIPLVTATAGDAYATDGDLYATYGNAEQVFSYATDGNVDAATLKEVHVSNVDELLSALAPDTHIYLAPGEYDLNAATPALYDYCYFRPVWSGGHELVLCSLSNCILEGESGVATDAVILQSSRMAAALTVEESYGLQFRNFSIGHTPGEGCMVPALNLTNCGNIYVENCDLYGCGTHALSGASATAVTVKDCVLHDCSYGAVSLDSCESVLFDHCTFARAGAYSTLSLWGSGWVQFQDCEFRENQGSEFLSALNSYRVFLDGCTVSDSAYRNLFSLFSSFTAPELNGCRFENVTVVEDSDGLFAAADYASDQTVLLDGAVLSPADANLPDGVSLIPEPTPTDADMEAVEAMASRFLNAYLQGDTAAIASMMSDPQSQNDVWDGEGTATGVSFQGLETAALLSEGQECSITAAFVPVEQDSFVYLVMELIRTAEGWQVTWYGLDA